MSFTDLARIEGYDLDAMEAGLVQAISRAARAEDKNEELQKLVANMEKELSAARTRIAGLEAENKKLEEQLASAMKELWTMKDVPPGDDGEDYWSIRLI